MGTQVAARPPLRAWLILAVAILAVSSAGAVFRTMADVGPLLKAAWRLQATALVLLLPFLWQLRQIEWTWRRDDALLMLASGACLWIHFGAWVWSLDHTSLTHSLLFVTSHAIIIVAIMAIMGMRPNRLEWLGAGLGVAGGAIALRDATAGGEVTLIGDFAAFVGALAIVGYLAVGRRLRSERQMPLFLYAFPVTVIGALLLTAHAMFAEGAAFGAPDQLAVFGWTGAAFILPAAYLALGPGLAGHTGINASLRWLPPLVISVAVVAEPVIGSAIGFALGVESIPGVWTLLGGPVMLAGITAAILGSSRRLAQEGSTDVAEPE